MKFEDKMEKFEHTSHIIDWLVAHMGIEETKVFSKFVVQKYNRFWTLRNSYGKNPTLKESFDFIEQQYGTYKRDTQKN